MSKDQVPRVSVVMNGYNSDRYLREALDSLLEQTFDDWELVFWDNCSEDESEAIVASYDEPRFHFYRASRIMTLAEGRNHAIERCRGEWVAFLDCDDLWYPEKLERQLALIDNSEDPDLGLVYARTLSFSSRGDEGERIYQYENRPLPEGKILELLLLEGCLIPMVAAVMRRDALHSIGPIPAHIRCATDYYLYVALAEKYTVACVQDVLCKYRVHEESATAKMKLIIYRESIEIMNRWAAHLEPGKLRKRLRVNHTLLGVEMFHDDAPLIAVIKEILLKGSFFYLLKGSFTRFFRTCVRGKNPTS